MSLARPADRIDHIDIAVALQSSDNVAASVRLAAHAHGAASTDSPVGVFARFASRLSNAEVQTDETEDRPSHPPASSAMLSAWRGEPRIILKQSDDLRPIW